MFRYILMTALLCGSLLIGHAQADTVWLSLNLEFNDPADLGSGGTWTLVAKADARGIAGVVSSFDPSSLNFDAATGFLTPIGFEVEESTIDGMRLEIVQGDDTSSITFDVGVIGGSYPSAYADAPGLIPLGANPDLGSFTGGVELATGSFDPGDIPTWIPSETEANVYHADSPPAFDADVFLTVRYTPIPEPTTLLLAFGSVIALAGMRRR